MPPLPRYSHVESFRLLTGLDASEYITTEIVAGQAVKLLDGPRLLHDLKAPPFAHLREYLTSICGHEITAWLLG